MASARECNICVGRRALLRSLGGWTSATALVSTFWPRSLHAAGSGEEGMPRAGDLLVFAKGDKKGQVITPDDLFLEAPPVLALPKDPASGLVRDQTQKNLILVLRMNLPDVPLPGGILAYSAICTHLGCTVEEWDPDRKFLRCPCHKGTYDPRQQGKVISGPPPRPLPVLPVKSQDGRVMVADVFSARVGTQ